MFTVVYRVCVSIVESLSISVETMAIMHAETMAIMHSETMGRTLPMTTRKKSGYSKDIGYSVGRQFTKRKKLQTVSVVHSFIPDIYI